jgi:hypothetical protein
MIAQVGLHPARLPGAVAMTPCWPIGEYGRPLFQAMPYRDTPERPPPEMRSVDPTPSAWPGTGPA